MWSDTWDTLVLTTSVISSPQLPFLLNAEDTKRGAQTRARTRGLGTNSRNELSLWGSCQLARTELHGNEPAFVCGGASLLMLVTVGQSSASSLPDKLMSISALKTSSREKNNKWRRKDPRLHKPTFLSREKSGGHLDVANLPADLRPDLRNYQLKNGLIGILKIFFSCLNWN